MLTIKQPTRKIELCADFEARADWEAAVEAEAVASLSKARKRMSDSDKDLDAARKAQDEAIERMEQATYTFTLQALPRTQYRVLVELHPPRPDIDSDAAQKVNVATFGDELIQRSIIAVHASDGSVVDFDPAAEWRPLADEMTNAQWTEFYAAAVGLNQETVAVPRKRVAS